MAKEPTTPTRKTAKEDTLLVSVIKEYFKYALLLLLIWVLGYFLFSPSWILLGLAIYIWKEKHTREQKAKIEISQATARDEKEVILARVEDLPSWVFFPDVERAEWLNQIIAQVWPYLGDYVEELLKTTVQQKIQESSPSVSSFKFVTIDLGDIPPRIGGVKVYTEHVRRDEIYMDLDIIYSSDSNIDVKVKGIKAGIKELQLHGTMRVIFKPLFSKMPLFGGISVFFLNNPTITFNLTSMANALDLPGLNDMLNTIIQEHVANLMVLPNRIVIPMAPELDLSKLRYPQPHGVLRVHVIEAKDLKKADVAVIGSGKSDPYAVVKVGAQKLKTKVINNTIAPKWDAVFEFIINEKDGQFLEIDLKDEDPGSKDDDLGSVNIDLSPVAEKGQMDSWLPLEDVKKGLIHVKLVWLYLDKDPKELDKICEKMKGNKTQEDLSSCIMMIHLDSARDLPRSKKMAEPSPYVSLSISQNKFESNVSLDTTEPRWEQSFRCLVHDPHFENLDLRVMDKKSDKFLGELTVPLKNLLSAPDMMLDQYFQLRKAETNCQVQMRLVLRVLTTEKSENWQEETENLLTKVVEKKPDETKRKETTAADSKSTEAQESKVTSSTQPIIKKEAAPAAVRTIPPAAQKKGSDDTEVRQRKSVTPSQAGEFECGRIQVTLRYSTQREKMIVVVHKCQGLPALDRDHFSDPYIKLYLLPDKSTKGKRKTRVIKDDLNPVFDETFEFPVTATEVLSRSLEVTVKNENTFKHDIIGMIVIDLGKLEITKAVTEWFDLRPESSGQRPVSIETDV